MSISFRKRQLIQRDAVGVVPYGHGREGKAAVTNRKILLRTSLIPLTTCVFVGVDAHGDPQSGSLPKNFSFERRKKESNRDRSKILVAYTFCSPFPGAYS